MNFVIATFSLLAGVASIFAGLTSPSEVASTIWFIGAGLWIGNAVVNFVMGLSEL